MTNDVRFNTRIIKADLEYFILDAHFLKFLMKAQTTT